MCYSAQVCQNYRDYVRLYGADISIDRFVQLYWDRRAGEKIRVARAMDLAFAQARGQGVEQIAELVAEFDAQQASRLQQELFRQRTRLANAERKLQERFTKAASESQRIATDKIAQTRTRLADLARTQPIDRDARIFPGWYAPVMVWEQGRRVIKPMRYQCRPAGKPVVYDTRYPGCYNARRDNLEGFWKGQFGVSHGLLLVRAFYENVSRHQAEGRALGVDESEQNVILEFRPQSGQDMLVACLWSHWTGADAPELLSFAAITDTPPPEVAAAGHDRCIIPIRHEHIDAWLNPAPGNLAAMQAILDDRERPYYAHRLAA